jgi:DNA repair protein RadC
MIVSYPKKKIRSPEMVAEAMSKYMANKVDEFDRKKEHFMCMGLDSGHRLIYLEVVSMGTLNASLVHPREVFRRAVHHAAASLILIHNHPSGESAPSAEDRSITMQLCECGKLMGISVLDHVIVSGDPDDQKPAIEGEKPTLKYYSFSREGLIKP